jgi:hypothetical protein
MDKRVPNATIRRVWLDETLTTAEAAALIGLSRVRLWVRAKALGLPARKEGRRAVIPPAEMETLWLAGVRATEIAALYGCPYNTVSQTRWRQGLPCRPAGHHAVLALAEYRAQLLRKSMRPGTPLTGPEHAILDRMRRQGGAA